MMIFDRFRSREHAEAFAAAAEELHADLSAYVRNAPDDELDIFPFELTPPIVYVTRSDDETVERDVERLVESFDGTFAGT